MTPNDPSNDLFDRFWAAYPRKVKKPQARKAWDKLKVTPEKLEVILSALEHWKACDQWQKDKGRFIPYPATWLNGEMYNDTPEPQPLANANANLAPGEEVVLW